MEVVSSVATRNELLGKLIICELEYFSGVSIIQRTITTGTKANLSHQQFSIQFLKSSIFLEMFKKVTVYNYQYEETSPSFSLSLSFHL